MTKSREILEKEFENEVKDNYFKACKYSTKLGKKEYKAPEYKGMLDEHGAIETAKRLIGKWTDGLLRLREISDEEIDCLDWSIEQSVINHRELFEAYYDSSLVEKAIDTLKWAHETPIEEMRKLVTSHW